jgi:cystathionine beta-lyase
MSREVGKSTRLVEGGRRKEWRRRLVNVPVERASTILFDRVDDASYRYGLQGTATHWALAEALTKLEPGAAGTILYPSGLAAITVPLLALLSPGDELLVPDSVYGPTRKFCDTILKRLMIATRYYDPLIGSGIEELIGDQTRAILLESPTPGPPRCFSLRWQPGLMSASSRSPNISVVMPT